MKRIYNYMLLAIMALATVSCLDEMNKDFPSAESGDEVQFGLSLPGLTKTIHGERNGDAYPIYWVDGDKVQVYSPQCLAGRNNAEYKVSVSSATQNYATSLTPTGDYGVQWGDQAAVFYSVYPSGEYTITDDGNTIKNLKINFSDDFEVINGVVTPKQADCLMFAKTSTVPVGETVNLAYSPMATAVIFTLKGPSDNDGSVNHEHTIQSIKLIAPEGTYIAGGFDVKLATSGGNEGKYVWTNWVEGAAKSNVITAQLFDKATGEFHKIKKGEQIKMSLFLAPLEDLAITNDWKIEILVQTDITEKDNSGEDVTKTVNKTFRKSLGMKNDDGTTVDTTLKPGMVHELPALPNLDVSGGTEWGTGDWMTNIPRNVYLSEISIPGTWNSLNSDCQSNTSISEQYALGVRAFHLDTRWQATRNGALGQIINPTIKGLSVCDGSTSYSVFSSSGRVNGTNAQTFESCLSSIVRNLNPAEYMVVFCTFAQDSYSGDNCPSTWMKAISDACDNIYNSTDEELKGKIYDASALTEDTLIGDVLNHVIVVINLDNTFDSYTLPDTSKCLFTYVPMNLGSDHYTGTNATIDGHIDPLYYSSKQPSGISMYTSHAQISTTGSSAVNCGDRGYSHPLTKRDTLVNAIWDWSKTNYGSPNYKHDHWMYLGLGGYILTYSSGNGSGYDTIENRYAPILYNRIDEMGKNDVPYYPVGIILMNNKHGGKYTTTNTSGTTTTLTYDFAGVCEKILLLNNAYRLQYDPNKPSDYNPNAKTKSAAPSYSSGMHDSNVAAFGWD